MSEKNTFAALTDIDVSGHVEKKGRFDYLSWPFAVAELRKAFPDATWEVARFDGKPFLATECGYFVEVAVTVAGVTLSQIHPVLDNNNKPVAKPSAFQINTSLQRCLVKAIALHGLGLCIYAGEDLPTDDPVKQQSTRKPAPVKAKPATSQTTVKQLSGKIISLDEVDQLLEMIDISGTDTDAFIGWVRKLDGGEGVESVASIPVELYTTCVKALNQKIDQQNEVK